ncbi:MAG: DUF1573 domain-containing protein [Candidatus Kapaibacteriales bacterium]
MKKVIYLLTIILIFNNAMSGPKIRFEGGDTYNWGKIRNTDSLLTTYLRIFNDGDDTLKIFSVRPGCGCTTSPLDKNTIEPNGFATAKITLQLPKHPGQHTKQIRFSTNDPENQEIYYYLKAEVVPPIKFFPDAKIIASNMVAGDTMTYKIIMENLTEEDIVIKEPTTDPYYVISTNLVPDLVIKPQEKFELVVKIVPDIVGNFNGTIKFKTTIADVPRVTIPIYGIVTSFKKQ